MSAPEIVFREATAADIAGIFRVRTAVTENALTLDQLAERGVTPASLAASFAKDANGWVAAQRGEIVAFTIADRAAAKVDALFVLPSHERRGIGGRLLDLALAWLAQNGVARVWLTTGPDTKAARFYAKRGWVPVGTAPRGDTRYELRLR